MQPPLTINTDRRKESLLRLMLVEQIRELKKEQTQDQTRTQRGQENGDFFFRPNPGTIKGIARDTQNENGRIREPDWSNEHAPHEHSSTRIATNPSSGLP